MLYAGTHGISQALTAIADAAALLDGRAIRFAFVGEGADKKRLERRVRELGLGNVTLLPGVPSAEMPALLAAADVCLVPLRKVPLFATFIPSKMFEYLAAGKAVIGSVTGEAAQILAEAGAVVVPPEDSGSLAAAIARAGRRPAAAGGDRPGGPCVRAAVLRPGGAGPGVPQDPGTGPARHDAMRLLVTGGSGFLGGYVLAEAARRGHSCVALARSPAAARAVAARGATPLTGDLDDGAALTGVFASAGCDALVNLASLGFGHAPGIVRAAVRARLDRAVFVSTTAVTTTLAAPSKAVRLAAEEEIRRSGLELDDLAADDDLRRGR